MRRLYIVPKDVYFGHAVDSSGVPVAMPVPSTAPPKVSKDGKLLSAGVTSITMVPVKHTDLFNPTTGSHYIALDDNTLLVSTSVDHSEWSEETWHGHPEVARLPHPIYEGNVKLKDVVGNAQHAPKQFKKHHLDALKAHPDLGVTDTDTVLDIARKAKAIHPLVKLSNVL